MVLSSKSPCLTRSLKPHNYVKWQGYVDNKYVQISAPPPKKKWPRYVTKTQKTLGGLNIACGRTLLWLVRAHRTRPTFGRHMKTFWGLSRVVESKRSPRNSPACKNLMNSLEWTEGTCLPTELRGFFCQREMSWRNRVRNPRSISLPPLFLSANKGFIAPVWWPFFEHQTHCLGNNLRGPARFVGGFLFLFIYLFWH